MYLIDRNFYELFLTFLTYFLNKVRQGVKRKDKIELVFMEYSTPNHLFVDKDGALF